MISCRLVELTSRTPDPPRNPLTPSFMPRWYETDEASDSGIGDTPLPLSIIVKRTNTKIYNQVETTEVTEARSVCAYSAMPDPAKYPTRRPDFYKVFYIKRYNNKANWVSLPRSWSRCGFIEPWDLASDPFYPANRYLWMQARKRSPDHCRCLHFWPSKIDNNDGWFSIDFFCGCPHNKGSFASVPSQCNASDEQLASLGRPSTSGGAIVLGKIRQKGGLYCPDTQRFYLCHSRNLRRFSFQGKPKRRRAGSRLFLTDVKNPRAKKIAYRNLKDNNGPTDSDNSENEPIGPPPKARSVPANEASSSEDANEGRPWAARYCRPESSDSGLTLL